MCSTFATSGLAVGVFRGQLVGIGATEVGVVYLTVDGAGVFYDRWFNLCHSATLLYININEGTGFLLRCYLGGT